MKLLSLAAWLTLVVALLHLAMVFVGAPAYRYFGAGEEMALADAQGAWWPALITLALVAVFALWAAYAFAGAGHLRGLPLLRPALLCIGSIFTLRGLGLFYEAFLYLTAAELPLGVRGMAFSAVALVIGLCYLLGTRQRWAQLA